MPTNPLTLYAISGVLAFIPALIWLTVIFRRHENKKIQALIFFGSIFSVVPIFLLHYFLNIFPQFDILQHLQGKIENQNINFILLFISVGIVEEIVKQGIVRFVDKKYILIHTVNDSIHFSLIGALGFAFAENIFYIYNIYTTLGIQQLFIAYIFRSIFTTTAHLIFSGFFGYYYGIAKFSINIIEHKRQMRGRSNTLTWISRLFKISSFEAYKKLTIFKGLGIAIVMHAAFNFLLQLNQVAVVAVYVLAGYGILHHLLSRRAGKLILITDVSTKQASSMAKDDSDVVVELLGMWFKKNKYVDVLHICQRLLERDPDNKIVQLFKAKALDKLEANSPYHKILQRMFKTKKEKSIADMVSEKETMPKKPPPGQVPTPPPEKKPEEKTFKLKL